jgi:hypothetical protein
LNLLLKRIFNFHWNKNDDKTKKINWFCLKKLFLNLHLSANKKLWQN